MADVQTIFDWLVDGAPGAVGPAAVVDRLANDVVAAGIPVERAAAFVRTLHPHIMGRSFTWKRGSPVEVREASFETLQTATFLRSPIAVVFQTKKSLRVRLDGDAPLDHEVLRELRREGMTDYFAAPLTFLSGETHGITFATRAPSGFSDAHIAALERLMRPLSRVAEILALTRTAVNLLNTYVGRNAGERIIAGKIHRGDTDTIRAAIWFSDLRGFTELAGSIDPTSLIRVLNELFECQVPAIERRGGEVLKFIGDGLLAIFPVNDAGDAALCDAALDAAAESFDALAKLNDARTARAEAPIRFGLALHFGDVAYGNIGGAGRLDFTCIGPAVNVASRLEGLTSKLGLRLVASAEFARRTTRPMRPLGAFELKGVAEAQDVFVPA